MFNEEMPRKAELPSSRQLLRSTLIAVVSAAAILIAIVLPAEYGVDPSGVGRVLGLTEMGEIKVQLAKEAEADRRQNPAGAPAPAKDRGSNLFGRMFAGLFVSPAAAQTTPAQRSDEVSVTLAPGQGAEIKIVMQKGAKAEFVWSVTGGLVNYDLHGDGGGKSISYKKGRSVPRHEGTVTAAFDGNHGWFWRNRGKQPVTVTLRVKGAYSQIKRVV